MEIEKQEAKKKEERKKIEIRLRVTGADKEGLKGIGIGEEVEIKAMGKVERVEESEWGEEEGKGEIGLIVKEMRIEKKGEEEVDEVKEIKKATSVEELDKIEGKKEKGE
jgi:hypothetical protein